MPAAARLWSVHQVLSKVQPNPLGPGFLELGRQVQEAQHLEGLAVVERLHLAALAAVERLEVLAAGQEDLARLLLGNPLLTKYL